MRPTVSFEARVVACEECGAPLVLGPAGGTDACSFCGARQTNVERSRAVPRSLATDENARLAQLAARDARPVAAPREIAELAPGGQLPSWKAGEALARWKAARTELRTRPSPEAAEQLHWLTKALADHFAELGEPLRERALLESALDLLELPRQRQALLAALCRSACRAGDLRAAEAWLALCDPRSPELEADSAFRLAYALLNTASGRFDAVLAVLGRSPQEVPISSEHEAACVVLRANAWEKLGQVATAVELLDHYKRHASGVGRYFAARFIAQHASFGLCKNSEGRAEALQRERGIELAGKAAGAPLLAFSFALGFGVLGLGSLVLIPFSLPAAVTSGFFVWLLFVAFALLGALELGKSRSARRLRVRGIPALAQIQDIRFGKQVTMGVPELVYRVLILPSSGYPFHAISTFHATQETRQRLPLGALALVRFDPEDQTNVQIEID